MKDLITKLRKSAGLSQEELSHKLGMSRPTLISIEKGKRDITLTELKKISDIFDIPIEIIVDQDLQTNLKVDAYEFSKKSFQRFHNLVLQCIKYGADKDGKITKTKLAKLVYLCDFANYYNFLKPISGFEYRKLARGPVAIEFFDIIDEDESICVERSENGRAILVSLVEQPDNKILNPEEQKLVQGVCKKWKKSNTQEIVDFTHKQIPWATCKDRDVIPYELINMESPQHVY